jgi:hypothetical protein
MKNKPPKIESKYPDLARIIVIGIYRDLKHWQSIESRKVDRRMPAPQRLRWVAAQDGYAYYSAQDLAGEDLSAGERKKFSVA